jgi:hypothetical protein
MLELPFPPSIWISRMATCAEYEGEGEGVGGGDNKQEPPPPPPSHTLGLSTVPHNPGIPTSTHNNRVPYIDRVEFKKAKCHIVQVCMKVGELI